MNNCHNQPLRIQDVEDIGASLPSSKSLTSRATKRTQLQLKWSKEQDIVKKAKLQKELRSSVDNLKNDIAKYKGHFTKLRGQTDSKDVQELQQALGTEDGKVRAAASAVNGLKIRVKTAKAEQKKAEAMLKTAKQKQKESAKKVKLGAERDQSEGIYRTLETQLKAATEFNKTNKI